VVRKFALNGKGGFSFFLGFPPPSLPHYSHLFLPVRGYSLNWGLLALSTLTPFEIDLLNNTVFFFSCVLGKLFSQSIGILLLLISCFFSNAGPWFSYIFIPIGSQSRVLLYLAMSCDRFLPVRYQNPLPGNPFYNLFCFSFLHFFIISTWLVLKSHGKRLMRDLGSIFPFVAPYRHNQVTLEYVLERFLFSSVTMRCPHVFLSHSLFLQALCLFFFSFSRFPHDLILFPDAAPSPAKHTWLGTRVSFFVLFFVFCVRLPFFPSTG